MQQIKLLYGKKCQPSQIFSQTSYMYTKKSNDKAQPNNVFKKENK